MGINDIKKSICALRNSKIARDSSLVIGYKMVIAGMGVLTSICLARFLNLEEMGIYYLYLSYFAIADLAGLSGVSVVVAKGAMKNEDYVYRIFLSKSLRFSFGFGLLTIALSFVLPNIFTNLPGNLICLSGIYTCFTGFNAYENFLTGKKLFNLSQKLMLIRSIATFTAVSLAAYHFAEGFIVLCAYVGSYISSTLMGTYCALRHSTPPKAPQHFEFWWDQGKRHIRQSIINVCSAQAARILLGNISPELLAFYHVGVYIPTRVKDNVKTILSVVSVHWGGLDMKGNLEKFLQNRKKIFFLSLFSSLTLVVISRFIIPIFYGEVFAPSVIVCQIFSVSIMLNMYTTMAKNIDIYQSDGKLYAKVNILEKIVLLTLIIVFIPVFSYVGPAIAILFVEIISFFIFYRYINKLKSSIL